MGKKSGLSKKEFDKIIKENLINSGVCENSFSYKIQGRVYDEYYSKDSFDKFVQEMKENYLMHYEKFNDGKGSELIEKNGRYGLMPPKMASVASSSRFCFLALKDGTEKLLPERKVAKFDVEFEKECKIFEENVNAPQLDAFVSDAGCDVYIEAKCHEIFDSHKIEFKNRYWSYFESDTALCQLLDESQKDNSFFRVSLNFFEIEKDNTRFDTKQFICHLMGIARQNKKKSKLVYMFFKPLVNDKEISIKLNDVFKELSEEIKKIFNSNAVRTFCKNNNIELAAIALESEKMKQIDDCNIINLLN